MNVAGTEGKNENRLGPLPVTPGNEFPAGTLAFDGSLDVTGTQIIWTATLSVTYGAGAFNGFNLFFAAAPTITNVTLDALLQVKSLS